MKRRKPFKGKPFKELKLPRRPGFFPYDDDGNLITDRFTTEADRLKYREDLKLYEEQQRMLKGK